MSKKTLDHQALEKRIHAQPSTPFDSEFPLKTPNQPPLTSVTSYCGPIPPPQFLKVVEAQITLTKRGQTIACSLGAICIIGAFIAIFFGYSLIGLGVILSSLAAFTSVFFIPKKQPSI